MRGMCFLLLACLFVPLTLCAQSRSLDQYIELGLKNSPFLAESNNQLQSARYDSLILRASFRPQVSVNGKILVTPSINGWNYDENIVNPHEYTLVGEVTQDILLGKNRMLQYRNASANMQLLAITARLSARELRKEITDSYLTAWSDYNRMKFADSTWKLMSRSQEILKPMVESGIYKATDYLAFVIETQDQRLQAIQLRIQYKTDLDSLHLLCGIMDTSFYDLAPPAIDRSAGTGAVFPLFPKFSADSLRIVTERDLIALRYRPRFGWFADAGLNSMQLNNAYRYLGTSFGVTFTVPIYDGGQKNISMKKIELQESTRQLYSNFYRNRYTLRTMQLEQDMAMNESLLKQYREQLGLAQTLIELSGKQLDKGEMSVTDYLNAIRSYKNIRAALNDAETKQLQLLNEMNFLNNY